MGIPFKYNVRNLRERWITSLMTLLGIGLVTFVFVTIFALGVGIDRTLVGTGHPLNLIVLRKGATEMQSEVSKEKAGDLERLEGIARGSDGEPLVSKETVVIANVAKRGGEKANLAIRGVGSRARELRDNIKLVRGEWFRPNLGELVIGKGALARFRDFDVGATPTMRGRQWKVVGVFEADGQAYESEVWGHVDDVREQFKRDYSTVIARCPDVATLARLKNVVSEDKQFLLEGKAHTDYYKDQNMAALMLKAMGFVMALVLSVGAIFGAANTMYAAVASRTREIATMRVLGFSRPAIWTSFSLEAALLGLAGGLVGSLVSRVLVHGLTTGTANWETFTEIAFQFQVTPPLMAAGIILAVITGVVGGLLPAWRASRVEIARSLRGL